MKIKFRAWIVAENKFCSLNIPPVPELTCNFGYRHGEYILEQFTGLCDKEGEDIYDGDIVQLKDGRRVVVSWGDDIAGFECNGQATSRSLYGHQREGVIVVGNIHQNLKMVLSK